MKAYVAVTDKTWFEHLRMLARHGRVDEVNFWTPKTWGGRFRVLERGQPLLFKLRRKGYDLRARIGRRLWAQVSDRLRGTIVSERKPASWLDLPGGYGDPVPVRPRVGQGIFRTVVADVYGRQCAVTREKAFPALEAAHIRPFEEEPRHYVRNGLLLRSDVHKLSMPAT